MNVKSAVGLLVALLAGISAAGRQNSPESGELEEGRQLYLRHCASCHGVSARGDGPVSSSLKRRPPDLTRLREPGQPFQRGRIQDVIDGEKIVYAHGSRDMPVWGRILREEGGYERAQDEILRLVQYLESIQADP